MLLLIPGLAQAQEDFSKGTVRISGSVSGSSGYGGSSLQVGIGVGYFPVDGLELGLGARSWFRSDNNVYELEPTVTYVFTTSTCSGLTPACCTEEPSFSLKPLKR